MFLLLGIILLLVVVILVLSTQSYLIPQQHEKELVGASAPQVTYSTGTGSQQGVTTGITTTALQANASIIPPPTDISTPGVPNAGNILLATTSAANRPIFNTILQSELTLSQQQAVDFYTATSPTADQITTTSTGIQTPSNMGVEQFLNTQDQITTTATGNLPQTFDAREKWPGKIGEPLDQLQCGSCFSFGSVTSFADRIRIFSTRGTNTVNLQLNQDVIENTYYDETVLTNTGEPLLMDKIDYRGTANYLNTLSPYFLAGCNVCNFSFNISKTVASIFTSRNLCQSCCGGGLLSASYIFMLINGIQAMGCPNTRDNMISYICSAGLSGCPVFRAKKIYRANLYLNSQLTTGTPQMYLDNVNAIKTEIMTNGSVSTAYYVYQNFASWPAGVCYDDTEGSANGGGHTVAIIGWTVRPNKNGVSKPCWIIRNSWANTWGENGYCFILLGTNFCRIESDVWAAQPFQVYDDTVSTPSAELGNLKIATVCSSTPNVNVIANPNN